MLAIPKTAVQSLVNADYSNFLFSNFRDNVENILFKWAGVEGMAAGSRGTHVDARIIEAVEEFVGQAVLQNGSPNLLANAGAEVEKVWGIFVDSIATNLLPQIATLPLTKALLDSIDVLDGLSHPENMTDQQLHDLVAPIFSAADSAAFNHPLYKFNNLSYDYITNRVTGDFQAFTDLIQIQQPSDGAAQQNYWQDLLPMINAVATVQGVTDAQYNTALTGTYLDLITTDDLSTLKNDSVIIGTSSADTISGTNASDYIVGGLGNDRLLGQSGGDVYGYFVGDGNDTINDPGTTVDKLLFGPGITQASLSFSRNGDNLLITRSGGGSVLIEQQFNNGDNEIEVIQFDNGDTISAATIRQTILTQASTNGNDTIVGFDQNETITGGTGNDSIDGSWGNDTFIINQGHGADIINDTSGTDTIQFGSGITWNGLVLTQNGNHLTVGVPGGGSLDLRDQFNSGGQRIENFTFADASTKTWQDVQTRILLAKQTSGNDTIIGFDENETITGGTGNDSIDGSWGNDTFIINQGHGADIINDTSGTDTIQFGSGITWSGLVLTQNGDHLTVGLPGGGSLDIRDQFNHGGQRIENFTFADASTKTWQDIEDRISGGFGETIGNDSLTGTANGEAIDALAGDDTVSGLGGNDSLTGNDGNDSLLGGDGLDTLVGGLGNDRLFGDAGNDSILGGDGVDYIVGGIGTDRLFGDSGNDQLNGGDDNDTLDGGVGFDKLYGNNGNDSLVGGNDSDSLTGGTGADDLTGGIGVDRFIFAVGDSGIGSANRDILRDFTSSSDKLDFSAIVTGITVFGSSTFNAGTTPELIFSPSSGDTLAKLDSNGDNIADMEFLFTGPVTILQGDLI